jgi:hypothetical protein
VDTGRVVIYNAGNERYVLFIKRLGPHRIQSFFATENGKLKRAFTATADRVIEIPLKEAMPEFKAHVAFWRDWVKRIT